MSKAVIEIKNLSKAYLISHEAKAAPGTVTFRDALAGVVKKPIELITGHKLKKEKFWALKEIDLNIEQGDVIGLIGKNGSGKSTLLKVLSRIVEPTDGEIIMRGKSASLLEVGTGFHPELTGRENIYFNGSILGMKKKEIDAKFDEIVAFSGVEKFLDTPVKFYSSGMYVRLAFAVAAHLEPDILIVDEVLAVGDAEFQRKSLGKMRDVTRNKQRTVIFVSHNMDSIRSICSKCIWLSGGKIMEVGETSKVVESYSQSSSSLASIPVKERKDRSGNGHARFTDIITESTVEKDRSIRCFLKINNKTKNMYDNFKLSIDINDHEGNQVSNLTNYSVGEKLVLKPGKNEFTLNIEDVNLSPGGYSLTAFIASDQFNSEIFDWVESASRFEIAEYDFYNTGVPPVVKSREVLLNFKYNDKK
ncbi:ABC transporter ATP-binding protein [Candidatus Saccharibacteria bacterium]|nr:ABC transporter ATP-binding protein [Candidatus Saccharibacteria bacterium]